MKDEARKLCWELRREGISLRDEGYNKELNVADWLTRVLDWEQRMINAAREALGWEFAERLSPLGAIDYNTDWDTALAVGGIRHAKNVAAVTKVFELVQAELLATRMRRDEA